MNYNFEIASVIQQYLDDIDIKYDFNVQNGTFDFMLKTDCKIGILFYTIHVRNEGYAIFSTVPFHAEPFNQIDPINQKIIGNMHDFINRINNNIIYGNFDFDQIDGEIRFRTSTIHREDLPSGEDIHDFILIHQLMYKIYENGIVSIIFTNTNSEEAFSICDPINTCEKILDNTEYNT